MATPQPTDRELIERWVGEPAPVLPLLNAFQARDGYVCDDAIEAIARALSIPLAELAATVSFYHHFHRSPPGTATPRVCDGPVCRMRGSDALLGIGGTGEGPGAAPMPCAGRCDTAIPVLTDGALAEEPGPLPPVNPGNHEECVFAAIREPGRRAIDGYRATGGYGALTRAGEELGAEGLLQVVADSTLAGRGGAAFPTAAKWRAVRDASVASGSDGKVIVCNADEGEPGCFKDRAILEHDPHAVIEGMALAALATGATLGFIYLRYEYPGIEAILERAIEEAKAAGLLDEFRLLVRRGGGSYVCGEEGALLESLEGRRPFPRNRPPYPVTHGFENRPTVVNNVETLASVPPIVLRGAEWYRSLGLGDHSGTKVVSVSGDINRPGNYEVPLGLPLRTLLEEWCDGAPDGRPIAAVTMAGLSGGFLAGAGLEVTIDETSIRAEGSFLGAGGMIVLDETRDPLAFTREAIEFFAEESCGKCFPCRLGTERLRERLTGESGPTDADQWTDQVRGVCETMKATSACGLGTAAPLVVESLLNHYPGRVERHVNKNGKTQRAAPRQ